MGIMEKKMETTIEDVQYLGHKKMTFLLEGLNMSKKMKFGYCTAEVKRVPFHPLWGNDSKTFWVCSGTLLFKSTQMRLSVSQTCPKTFRISKDIPTSGLL